MIDFANGSFVKLSRTELSSVDERIKRILIENENLLFATKGTRDSVVFTSRRIIIANVQGMTGKKIAISSIPYSKIVAFATETGGTMDLDAELDVWVSGLGVTKFEFTKGTDMDYINRLLGTVVG